MKNQVGEINIASVNSFEKMFVNDKTLTQLQETLVKKSFIHFMLNELSLTDLEARLCRNGITKKQSAYYVYNEYGIVVTWTCSIR